jgi:hypothetical protein
MSYKEELRDCYLAPEGTSKSVDEWMDMLFHGNQSDCDIMELIAERDILRGKLEIAMDALKKIDAYPKSDMWFQHNIYVQEALVEIGKIGEKNE